MVTEQTVTQRRVQLGVSALRGLEVVSSTHLMSVAQMPPRREPADDVASHRASMLPLPRPDADLVSSYRFCSLRTRRHCWEPACSSRSSADRLVNRNWAGRRCGSCSPRSKQSRKNGFPDDKARIVSENARTLKFDQSGFEDQ